LMRPIASRVRRKSAGQSAASQPALIPQPHGGALLSGGKPGNAGGPGRPKDELRAKMRTAADAALDAMLAALAGERLATDAAAAVLNDADVQALGAEVVASLQTILPRHLTARLTNRELSQYHETLAKYGVGVQAEVDSRHSDVRYIIRLPSRAAPPAALPAAPIAVIDP
jgi:hypothetical protein